MVGDKGGYGDGGFVGVTWKWRKCHETVEITT